MTDDPQSLREHWSVAEAQRQKLENAFDSTSATFQENLAAAIAKYEQCVKIAREVSLFSSNETLEDVASVDLQYFLLHYYAAELILRVTTGNRKENLQRAQTEHERFLKLVDSYDLLSREDAKLYEQHKDQPSRFSTASTTDAAARRNTKIARFKEEKVLKTKLEHLGKNPAAFANDESLLRELHLTHINLCIHQTYQSLESTAQELQILAMAPSSPPEDRVPDDARARSRQVEQYSDRLDKPISELLGQGPILSKEGRPLRPFTLLDSRQRLQQGVFRPDHSLPTMTIDEYLEEEKKRGGIIEGGGAQSGIKPEVDEDDHRLGDQETLKQRHWDDWKDDNPRGAGNTMNMG
ncbi:hypothetical protein FH972_022507 [Carpinus fangiana]|uniref:TAP42-like family protein n=1 Tax=Carpinus fangiana TaxID=176857 RepID=A0A5N6KSS3_9ROSI|nr:hypothetical protein FH972_022507 [Carpinus fangiana]